jgi:hypothetical protein
VSDAAVTIKTSSDRHSSRNDKNVTMDKHYY